MQLSAVPVASALCRPHGWGWPMIMLAISLLFTLVERRQLLQARAPACVPRVGAAANAFIARCALLQRGVRVCGPQCVRPCGEAKGMARVALRCDGLQAFADLFSGSAQPWSPGGLTFMLVGAPSNCPQHAHTRSHGHILLTLACAQPPAHTHTHTHAHAHTHTRTQTHTHSHMHTQTLAHTCAQCVRRRI